MYSLFVEFCVAVGLAHRPTPFMTIHMLMFTYLFHHQHFVFITIFDTKVIGITITIIIVVIISSIILIITVSIIITGLG